MDSSSNEGIPRSAYKTLKVKPFDCAVHGIKEFDPLVHIEIKEKKEGEQEDEDEEGPMHNEDGEAFGETEEKFYERQKVENIYKHWLKVEPAQADFAAILREAL